MFPSIYVIRADIRWEDSVPIAYTRVAERLGPKAFRDRGLLPAGSNPSRVKCKIHYKFSPLAGDVSLRVYEHAGASLFVVYIAQSYR